MVPSLSTNMAFFFIDFQGFEEFVILFGKSDGDAEAVLAAGDLCAVADDDAVGDQMSIQSVGIVYLDQDEIGLARENATYAGEFHELMDKAYALGHNLGDLLVYGFLKSFERKPLGGFVDVVGVFDHRHQLDGIRLREGEAKAQGGHAAGLGEGLQDNEVGIAVDCRQKAGDGAEIDVSFVNDHNTVETLEDVEDGLVGDGVAGRIVGGAEEDGLGAGVAGREEVFDRQGEVIAERHMAHRDIVDVRCHFIHTVARGNSHYVVYSRVAEHPEYHIDSLIGSVAEEDILRGDSLDGGYAGLEFLLSRVRITVPAGRVGALVGVQEDAELAPELVTGRTVRAELPDVGAYKRLDVFCLHRLMRMLDFPPI